MSNIKHLFSRILYIIIFLSSSLSVMGQADHSHHERQTSEEGDKTDRKSK